MIAREAKEAFNDCMPYLAFPNVRMATWQFWPLVLAVAVLGAAVVALLTNADPSAADPELLVLLRFMAVVKAAMAMVAMALVAWRLNGPVRPATALIYVAAVSSMAAGAGLIWQLEHVAAGAVMVHGGLVAAAVLAWFDRAGWDQATSAKLSSMRSSRSFWPGVDIRVPPRGTSRQQPRSPSIGSDTSSRPVGPSL